MDDLTTIVPLPLDEAARRVRDALAEHGFGVLTEIDVARVFHDKLDVERTPLTILGACNPVIAHAALERDGAAALNLPCNVVLDESTPGVTRVSIADPTVVVPGRDLADLTHDARARLRHVIRSLEGAATS
jgi:uncharacterized protein (DUF302 family)